jgi:PHP family Zn ribbon phosphoesterase
MDQLTTCKTCSKEVAKSACNCPHCGAKLKMGTFEKLLILIGVFFILSFISALLTRWNV